MWNHSSQWKPSTNKHTHKVIKLFHRNKNFLQKIYASATFLSHRSYRNCIECEWECSWEFYIIPNIFINVSYISQSSLYSYSTCEFSKKNAFGNGYETDDYKINMFLSFPFHLVKHGLKEFFKSIHLWEHCHCFGMCGFSLVFNKYTLC